MVVGPPWPLGARTAYASDESVVHLVLVAVDLVASTLLVKVWMLLMVWVMVLRLLLLAMMVKVVPPLLLLLLGLLRFVCPLFLPVYPVVAVPVVSLGWGAALVGLVLAPGTLVVIEVAKILIIT